MARMNRVTPTGEIMATPERGLFMGNRGVLHNDRQEIITPYKLKAWIICLLEFKGRKRPLMRPNHYTELFFLDEATALAAGHRPCFECRRERAIAFREAWVKGNPTLAVGTKAGKPVKMGQIDAVLDTERLTPARHKWERRQQTFTAVATSLPPGTFVKLAERPCLIWHGRLFPWTPGGYLDSLPVESDQEVEVLTPRSTVQALAHGYLPVVHDSADNRL